MDLPGPWVAAPADEALRRAFHEEDFDDAGWQPVPVPGHWRSTPAFAESDGPLLYRTRFAHPAPPSGRRAWLVLDGLFSQGDVWMDGAYLGDTEGWFAPHEFEVTGLLRDRDEHALAVEVANAGRRGLAGAVDGTWNAGGLWRPVHVEETGPVRISRLSVVCREAVATRAVLRMRAELDTVEARPVVLRTTVAGREDTVDQPLAAGHNRVAWTVTVPDPALWWPWALGERAVHDLAVDVVADGQPSDRRELRVGFRTVTAHRSVLRVNGERVFAKGAVLPPTRPALAEATAAEMAGEVRRAVGAGLDLLRVHAHVARPELYAAADEAGLLLWQDLPLLGPLPRGVRHHAVTQARQAVDLLGHHPSVAVWCAHDRPSVVNRVWLDGAVRRALEKADGTRPVMRPTPRLPGDAAAVARAAATVPRLARFPAVPPAGVPVLRRLKYRPTGGFVVEAPVDGELADACRPVDVVTDPLPATVLPSEPLALDVHVVSDLRRAVDRATVTARLAWNGGEHTWAWQGRIPADRCTRVGMVRAVAPAEPGPLALHVALDYGDVRVERRSATAVAGSVAAPRTR